jgi:RHS repeat-associated protein
MKYSSFGWAQLKTVGIITNTLRLPGQYYDNELNLCYNYYRYYDSRTGRYFSVDKIGFIDRDHSYVYADDNPIMNIDPLGLIFFENMYCIEIDRERDISVIAELDNPLKVATGYRVMCTDVVIEDPFSCVCKGREEKIIQGKNIITKCDRVIYECCNSEAKSIKVKKLECIDNIVYGKPYYKPTGRIIIRHGNTGAAFGHCSMCPMGEGHPM